MNEVVSAVGITIFLLIVAGAFILIAKSQNQDLDLYPASVSSKIEKLFPEFLQALSSVEAEQFREYVRDSIDQYSWLEGVARHGTDIWRKLALVPGQSLFELGPGHGFFAIKAALNGLDVVAVEHPDSHYLQFMEPNLPLFQNAITQSGGSFTLLKTDILIEQERANITSRFGLHSFDHIFALDVLRPDPKYNQSTVDYVNRRFEAKWGNGTGIPKYGIYKPSEVKIVSDFLISLKKPNVGSIYVNHTASMEREVDKVTKGDLRPDWPFQSVTEIEQSMVQMNLTYTSSERMPTTRNPLSAATLYHF